MAAKIIDESTITINNVELPLQKLLDTFPESYFAVMLRSRYRESTSSNITINFPTSIDQYQLNGKRFIEQIAYRLRTGKYQYPGIDPTSVYTIMPKADGIRFMSFPEMNGVFQFLLFNESEKKLVEDKPDPIIIDTDDNDEPDFDAHILTDRDYDGLDENLLHNDDDDFYDDYDEDDNHDY